VPVDALPKPQLHVSLLPRHLVVGIEESTYPDLI
jgi:hypothetical protein